MNFLHLRNTLNPSTVIKINVRISYISTKFKGVKKSKIKKTSQNTSASSQIKGTCLRLLRTSILRAFGFLSYEMCQKNACLFRNSIQFKLLNEHKKTVCNVSSSLWKKMQVPHSNILQYQTTSQEISRGKYGTSHPDFPKIRHTAGFGSSIVCPQSNSILAEKQ